MKHYDIVIIGAGLVGSSLALALQHQGLQIALLERNPPRAPSEHLHQDQRPLSLSYGSQKILDTLNLWETLKPHATPLLKVNTSEQGRLGGLHFSAKELNVPALGYVIPFSRLEQALLQQITHDPAIELITINELTTITRQETETTIAFTSATDNPQQIQTPLLIAADGMHSSCRKLLQMSCEEIDQGDQSLIFELSLQSPHQNTAHQRFTALGSMAVLPLFQPQKARMVWTLNPKAYTHVQALNNDKRLQHINDVYQGHIGPISACQSTGQFPLKVIHSREQIRPGLVLLGNAAHTFYPLTAQGYNLSLKDVAVLAEVISEAHAQHQPIGAHEVLQRYLSWRQKDQHTIKNITQGTHTLFGLELPLLGKLRGLGMLATDLLPPIKNRLAKQIMGLHGKSPKLTCGIPLHDA